MFKEDKPLNRKANYKKSNPALSLLKSGLDLILPPRCPVTGDIVDRIGAISPAAWKDLTFITPPFCACCGIPFSVDLQRDIGQPEEFLCAACLTTKRPFDGSRSVFVYNSGCRSMILSFKHGDALHLHTTLAPLLYQLGESFMDEGAVLVPVPLHWIRLIRRRYNQAAVLATEISKLSGTTPCWPDALVRTRNTPPQGHKNAKDRHRNVSGAFDVNPRYADKISGKNIILIDDVFTTGATLEECSMVLKAAGAKTVHILTIARVVQGE